MSKKAKPTVTKKTKKSVAKIKAPMEFPIWIPVIVFVMTTFVFFWGQISGDTFFWEDFTEFVYPTQSFAASEMANGDIPFWNPYSFAGMPFLADLQVGFFYPFNRLLNLFVSDGKLPVWALQFMIIIHFIIAQLSMFFLCRSWKISSFGSMIAAVSYSFSLMLVCHVIHPMIIYHLAWFPLVVMFFYKGINNREYRSAIMGGLIFGMSMLSGHPQMTLYEAFFLFLMFAWYFISGLKSKELNVKSLPGFITTGLLPVVIAAGVFCIQFLPSQELAGLSQRAEMSYEKSAEGSLEFKQVYTAIVPKFFGFVDGAGDRSVPYHLTVNNAETGQEVQAPYYNYWESAFYFGIAALILGLFGAISDIRTRKGSFLVFTAVFGFLFAMGANGFIYPIFYELPFFGSFRNPSRMMLYFAFALSLFAGIGFDKLWTDIKNKKVFLRLIIASGIILFFAILAASGALTAALDTPEQFVSDINGFGAIALLFVFASVVVASLIQKGLLGATAGGAILLVLAFIDLTMVGSSFNSSKNNPEDSYRLRDQEKALFSVKAPDNIFRVNMRMYQPQSFQAMQRNQGMLDNIMLIEGYNPLILDRVMPPIDSRDTVNMLYNVKYQVDIGPDGRPMFSQRNDQFPRAWLVHDFVQFSPDEVEDKMRHCGYDYSQLVVLEDNPGIEPKYGKVDVGDEVECTEYNSNSMKYKVKSNGAGILCLSEIYYPAWKAYIDGKEARVMRANYCFRAVVVPEGEHTVELKYESSKFEIGLYITLFTFLLSVLSMFLLYKRIITIKAE